MNFKKITIICGHYGSGKTNLSLNLAFELRRRGEAVTLADMDIVNPYFRSSEYRAEMERRGISVIAPSMAGTTQDMPAISPSVYSLFNKSSEYVIIDAGGDDAGALALGRLSSRFADPSDYDMLFVVNRYRPMISEPAAALEILREIESACRIKVTGIVNNSHLGGLTSAEDVEASLEYAGEIAALSGLELKFTAAERSLCPALEDKAENLFPVDIIVKKPWETT